MRRMHANQDRDVIKQLQQKSKRLHSLMQRIRELELECNRLQHSAHQLSAKLSEYRQIKDEWEWFFENSLEMLCICGIDGYFKRVNPAFANNLGYTHEQLVSRPFIDFVHPEDKEKTLAELRALEQGQDSIDFENRYQDSDGNWRWLCWHCPALEPSMTKLFAIAHDLTERKRSEAEILYRALHDPLTDLFNRAALEERLELAIARVKRNPGSEVAFYLIDLDGFKAINDTYGHMAGDQLLKYLGGWFKQIQRESDFVCRFGGDEFAWLTEEEGEVQVEPLAERIMAVTAQPITLGDITVNISCSIGISVLPRHASNAHMLLSQADAAMYSVKKFGKAGYKKFQ